MGPFEPSGGAVLLTIQLLVVVMVVLASFPFFALHLVNVLDRRALPRAAIHASKPVPAGRAR